MKDPCNKALIPCWKTETKDATVDKWGEIQNAATQRRATKSVKSRDCVWLYSMIRWMETLLLHCQFIRWVFFLFHFKLRVTETFGNDSR